MNFFKKNQIINITIVSIIPFLIWGPFFPDLIVSLSSLVFLFYIFKNKNFYYFNNKPVIIFFIFCLYCILVSLLRAEDKLLSFKSSLFYFRIGVFSCLIWYLIEKDKNILKYFYYSLMICFSIFSSRRISCNFFLDSNVVGLPGSGARVSSFFGEEFIMGSYLSRLFPLLFALFLIKKKNKYEIYYVGILFIFSRCINLYNSRKSCVLLFLNIINCIYYYSNKKISKI